MSNHSVAWSHACVAIALLVVCGGLSYADWHVPVWEDDFNDGDVTSPVSWTEFVGAGGGSSSLIDTGGGDYMYAHTAPYASSHGAGWAGAYVAATPRDNQGLEGWAAPYDTAADGVGAMAMLRYNPTTIPSASGGPGFGTGYALTMTYNAAGSMVASLIRLDDGGYADIGAEETISISGGGYSPLEFRFLIMEDELMARAWEAGTAEPDAWNWSGITDSTYAQGYGGVGTFTLNPGAAGQADFDDVKYGTPEPTTMILMATGLGAIALRRRRKKS